MIRKRIGIVSEGVTDQVVLKTLLPVAIPKLIEKNIIKIQPSIDQTSLGGGPEGGWTEVFKWCLATPPILRRQLIFRGGLFESNNDPESSPCDALLIHLDSDICESADFQSKTTVSVKKYDLNKPGGRGKYIFAVLTDWLWPEEIDSDDLSWTILAPAVESVETWLVAGLSDKAEPEKIKRPDTDLLDITYNIRGNEKPDSAKRIRKNPDRYRSLALKAKKNINAIIDKCPHFKILVGKVSKLYG